MTASDDGAGIKSSGSLAAIEALLGGPGTRWIVDRVRRRLETGDAGSVPDGAGGSPLLTGTVRLANPTGDQRAAASRLAGSPRRPGSGLTIDLGKIELVLRRGPWPAGLADAVVTLTGPVADRRAERAAEAAAWGLARAGLGPASARFPELVGWWDAFCAAGNLKRAARAEEARLAVRATGRQSLPEVATDLVAQVVAVLAELPTSGEPLAVLARRVVGDAHGLDVSRPLGRLAAAVVGTVFMAGVRAPDEDATDRGIGEVVGGEQATTAGPTRETSAREAWAAAGVVMSAVASTVLCLGVPGSGQDSGSAVGRATSAALEAMLAARAPVVLTLDQVRSGGVAALPAGAFVHVCENPSVIEVVTARWARSGDAPRGGLAPVLVCTWGQPSTAVIDLLTVLASRGAAVRYHGDLDWAGLRIAQSLRSRVTWEPWRFTASDYLAAVRNGAPSRTLTGTPAESPWNPALAEVMTEHGLAVEEEAVADLLAADLLR